MNKNISKNIGLGTIEGVFIPTILTILGVILYLRLGWVVGNVGFIGTLTIIVLAHVITLFTGLSVASMVSNSEIGAGGAYAIISRSLGLEAGGAIGIPLFLSQAFSVAFYIIGFAELWHSFFPAHHILAVCIITWLVLAGISLFSAKLAFRVQYFILFAVVLSLISFFAGPSINEGPVLLWGKMQEATYWETFAIFFPAVTGILAGVSMSGELRNPRTSIIRGTLTAIVLGFVVYVLSAFWFAYRVPEEMLLKDTSIILRLGFSKTLIIAGIMGAVLSSALSTLVGAPRTLAALAEDRLVPFSKGLALKAKNGEPRNAIILSAIISLAVLLVGNLNMLASLLTLFFLMTYGTINLTVLIEQATGVVSFRPQMRISILIPIIGFLGCIFSMLLISKLFTLVTFIIISMIYYSLAKRNLISTTGDIRGGLFALISEWAAQKAMSRPYHPRLWKPFLLVPVENHDDLRRIIRLVRSIIYPSGRLYCLTMNTHTDRIEPQLNLELDNILLPLKEEHLFSQKINLDSQNGFVIDLPIVMQTLLNTFLPPNAVLFTISHDVNKRILLEQMLHQVRPLKLGVILLYVHPKYGFGQERKINLWLRDKSPNTNLAVLTALQLFRNWDGLLTLSRTVTAKKEAARAAVQMELFKEKARLPVNTEINIIQGDFTKAIISYNTDITIVGMPKTYQQILDLVEIIPNTVIFVSDSGLESALV
ncbi:amino acid permease [Desulfosporosinus shakirovi]|uniref:amino acid permease n=1 Tax=Desulfosporosinus shakirovi TaxID=2885154 RepID=UPI001E4C3FC3|nr:amino acid permease [Desulfosporosinus sp. SRJS8]MCB8814949.1 amino acid permease [Desulfosporosinus sp. SRJS8]